MHSIAVRAFDLSEEFDGFDSRLGLITFNCTLILLQSVKFPYEEGKITYTVNEVVKGLR